MMEDRERKQRRWRPCIQATGSAHRFERRRGEKEEKRTCSRAAQARSVVRREVVLLLLLVVSLRSWAERGQSPNKTEREKGRKRGERRNSSLRWRALLFFLVVLLLLRVDSHGSREQWSG
jgi:hypothetical protein